MRPLGAYTDYVWGVLVLLAFMGLIVAVNLLMDEKMILFLRNHRVANILFMTSDPTQLW